MPKVSGFFCIHSILQNSRNNLELERASEESDSSIKIENNGK